MCRNEVKYSNSSEVNPERSLNQDGTLTDECGDRYALVALAVSLRVTQEWVGRHQCAASG
jgi:hypothetical protein